MKTNFPNRSPKLRLFSLQSMKMACRDQFRRPLRKVQIDVWLRGIRISLLGRVLTFQSPDKGILVSDARIKMGCFA